MLGSQVSTKLNLTLNAENSVMLYGLFVKLANNVLFICLQPSLCDFSPEDSSENMGISVRQMRFTIIPFIITRKLSVVYERGVFIHFTVFSFRINIQSY